MRLAGNRGHQQPAKPPANKLMAHLKTLVREPVLFAQFFFLKGKILSATGAVARPFNDGGVLGRGPGLHQRQRSDPLTDFKSFVHMYKNYAIFQISSTGKDTIGIPHRFLWIH
jgi:hypothetical protein